MKELKWLLLFLLLSGCGSQERMIEIERIRSNERIQMAKIKIVEKYFHEIEHSEKIIEAGRLLRDNPQ